jgi:pyruvate/2-oxoglutarate dehydrogenase complex dihydrolipoamide dehydrogenase (E3) component
MIASARAAHVARTAQRLGVRATSVEVDFEAVVARKDAIVKRWRDGVMKRIGSGGDRLTFVAGHARFVGEREVEVSGQRYRGGVVVINVGARPAVPRVAGLESVPWLDNRRVMELRALPEHLVVLGAGYVGCEFAQMFRRFGSRVTVVGHGPRLLEREEQDASNALEKVFRDEGIALRLGANVESAAAGADGSVALRIKGGDEVRGSHLLVATGRRPNTDDLRCDAAGIHLDAKGFVEVDDHFEANVRGTYAVGDAIAQPQFTHTAWDDHRLLFDHLSGRGGRGRSGRWIPSAVFTDPQVARVGLSEAEAKARGVAYEAATMPFGSVARAIEIDETAGVMKVLIDPKTERILGATLVGAEAGELIHVFVALMEAGATARAIVDAEFVHPTFAEGVQTLVMQLDRYALR